MINSPFYYQMVMDYVNIGLYHERLGIRLQEHTYEK